MDAVFTVSSLVKNEKFNFYKLTINAKMPSNDNCVSLIDFNYVFEIFIDKLKTHPEIVNFERYKVGVKIILSGFETPIHIEFKNVEKLTSDFILTRLYKTFRSNLQVEVKDISVIFSILKIK